MSSKFSLSEGSAVLASTIQTSNAIDPKNILQNLASHGLTLKDPSSPQLFNTSQDLQKGTITTDEFRAAGSPLVAPVPAIDPLGAGVSIYDALTSIADSIKAEAESSLLRERYLAGFETARMLEPESVKIVVAAKEVVEDALSSQETVHLQADTLCVRAFLCEDIIPFLQEVSKRSPSAIPLDPIRRRREQLKDKLELQRRNVNVYLQHVEAGLANMKDGTYYTKTNHLPAYVAAAALEVLVRAYWILMGRLDGEDPMLQFDSLSLSKVVQGHVESASSLLDKYKDARLGLIEGKLEYYVHDAGAAKDVLCPKIEVEGLASQVSAGEAETKLRDDGSYRYSNESLSGHDRSSGPGQELRDKVRGQVERRLSKDGVFWKEIIEQQRESMELVADLIRAGVEENDSHKRRMITAVE